MTTTFGVKAERAGSNLDESRHVAKGRKTGGRQRGTANTVTREIRQYAQQYTIEALEGLALIARNSTSDAVRVSAVLSPRPLHGTRHGQRRAAPTG